MEPLLEIKNLRTYFETAEGTIKAVDDVSLVIPRGKISTLVGESGCGKSVTALSILRLVSEPGKILSGEILLHSQVGAAPRGRPQLMGNHVDDGQPQGVAPTHAIDLLKLSEKEMCQIRGDRIAMIFQEPMTSLNPVFTVGNQIAEAVRLHQGASRKEGRERAIEMLKKVGIPNPDRRVDDYPHQMSGGMRQRVMIAMALSCNPELLIADEPTTALDVTIQAQILELIGGLVKEMGMSLLLITHDLGIVAEYAEQVTIMYAGKIAEEASVTDLFRHPSHPYTKGLMESIPSLKKKGETRLRTIPGAVPHLARLPQGCSFQERCERVQVDCRQKDPLLQEIEKDHCVRCWHYY